jgi:predicted choloylglycine hydrolase
VISRRALLAALGATPAALGAAVGEARKTAASVRHGDRGPFPLLEVRGSYREIGYQIGRRFRRRIRAVIETRRAWHEGLLELLRSPAGRRRSARLLALTRSEFPHLLDEIRGVAEGAAIGFDAMWALTIKAELGTIEAEPPGCSTIALRAGHAAYSDRMFLVRVRPPSGVGFVAMVYPGTITGNGPALNEAGVVQTTNFIGSTHSEIGVPRYVIGRAILEATDLEEAVEIATLEPRAYPYHHNLASIRDGDYRSVETTPAATAVERPRGLFVHTNHLLHVPTADYPHENAEYRATSSMPRYAVLQTRSAGVDPAGAGLDDLLAMLSAHERAPYSPCRHPRGEVRGQTLGTAVFDLAAGTFRLYAGNPCTSVPAGTPMELAV